MTDAGLRGRRVLVTGGLGFIGSNVAVACVHAGARVTVYDSLDPACGGNAGNVDEIADRVTVLRKDIRSKKDVAAAMDGADLVVNCAAYTSHIGSMSDATSYIEVNCIGLMNVLEAASALAVRPRVVQLGASTQVGRARSEPITEEDPEHPVDVYSATKTAAEKLALAYGSAHHIPVTVVRLANVYGPRAKVTDPGLGSINYFVGLALQDKEITLWGDGAQRRTITYVDDVVDAILGVAVSERCAGEVFFAASDRHCSLREVTDAIVQAVGRGRVVHTPWPQDRAAIEVGDSVISSEKIARYIGWRASVGLDEGMRRTAAYYEPRMRRYIG